MLRGLAGPKTGGKVLVAFASQTGAAAQIAWKSANALIARGDFVRVAQLGALTPAELAQAGTLLVVTSTYGIGESPDSARGFERKVMPMRANLKGVSFAVLALGDRSYEDFCGFGQRLDKWLATNKARRLFTPVLVDGDKMPGAKWFPNVRLNFAQNLLRFKAIVNLKDEPQPVVLHGVQHVLYPEVRLDTWPDDDHRSRLVLIVKDVEEETVQRLWSAFLGQISGETAAAHPQLRIVGLVGSIDNDMVGTDITIGTDSALHRIVDAIGEVYTDHLQAPTAILMHPRVWAKIIKTREDTSPSTYLVGPGSSAWGRRANDPIPGLGASPRPVGELFGVSVYCSANMPLNLGSGADETAVIVGDFSEGLILDRQGITTDTSEHVFFTSNQTIFRAEERMGFTAARDPTAFQVVAGSSVLG